MGKHVKDKASVIAAQICGHVICIDAHNKKTVFYEIQAVIESEKFGKFIVSQHHRYQDFDDLSKILIKTFRGDADMRIIPCPPPKTWAFFTNVLSKQFIQKRTEQLSSYCKALATLRRLRVSDPVLHFFGYYPRTKSRESSVVFKRQFGMKITDPGKKYDVHAVVKQFKEIKHKKQSPAEASGRIAINDLITRVNGQQTLDLTYGQIFELIKSYQKPIILTFLGFPIPATEEQVNSLYEEAAVRADRAESIVENESDSDFEKDAQHEISEPEEVEESEDDGKSDDSEDEKKKPKRHVRKAYDSSSD